MTQIIKGPIRRPFSHLYLSLWAPVEQPRTIKYRIKEKHSRPTAAHIRLLCCTFWFCLAVGHEAHGQVCVVAHVLRVRRRTFHLFISSLGVNKQQRTLNILLYVKLSSGLSHPLGQFNSVTDCLYSNLMTLGHLICVTCTESITLNVRGSPERRVNNTWKSLTRPIQVNKLSCVSELFRTGSSRGVRVIRMQ